MAKSITLRKISTLPIQPKAREIRSCSSCKSVARYKESISWKMASSPSCKIAL